MTPKSTTVDSVGSAGALTVKTPAQVPTKHGAVDAVVKRTIPYSKLTVPWKKALRAVPFLGTALTINDMLAESCIRPMEGEGAFEKCYQSEQTFPPEIGWYAPWLSTQCNTKPRLCFVTDGISGVVSGRLRSLWPNQNGGMTCGATPAGGPLTNFRCYFTDNPSLSATVDGKAFCGPSIGSWSVACQGMVIEGYNQIELTEVDQLLDQYPSQYPEKLEDTVRKLWDDLAKLPVGTPIDSRSIPDVDMPTPTITGTGTKAGDRVSETTSNGSKITQEISNIAYGGNTSTVTVVTNTTYINNAGDIIDQTSTETEGATDCEKNPNSLACQELGTPPESEITREEVPFSIEPINLPGGSCPPGFTFPIPGNPQFSWQPLCSNLPAVRAVILVLASTLAAFIFVGGLKA